MFKAVREMRAAPSPEVALCHQAPVIPYPPLSHILCRAATSHQAKSFTIDAILGNQSAIDYSTSSPGERDKCESSRKNKCKRVRTIFTPEQLERLEAEFERQQYMVGPERLYLAHALNLTEAQVKVWFQNRRIKWRKQHLEVQQQRLAAIKQRQQRQQHQQHQQHQEQDHDQEPQEQPEHHQQQMELRHHRGPVDTEESGQFQ